MNISFIRGGLIFSYDVPINTSILSCFSHISPLTSPLICDVLVFSMEFPIKTSIFEVCPIYFPWIFPSKNSMFPPFVPQVVPDGMEFVFAVREAMSHGISMGKPMENTGESRKNGGL